MVGGTVIETIKSKDKIWINCEDHGTTCAIYVDADAKARSVSEGDMIWWQGGKAFWTPKMYRKSSRESKNMNLKCGIHYEIELNRKGCSGVPRPK
jgi:hypothetical protein